MENAGETWMRGSELVLRQDRTVIKVLRVLTAAASVATVLLLSGCGYALVGRGSNIPEDVQAVYLEALTNRTPRAEVEQFLTQAIADELVTRQRFTLVTGTDDADAVLRGIVTNFQVIPLTFDADGRAEEYEISVTADMSFERVSNEPEPEVLWANQRYLFRDTYELEADADSFFDRENLAILETAERFAETMVSDLLEGF